MEKNVVRDILNSPRSCGHCPETFPSSQPVASPLQHMSRNVGEGVRYTRLAISQVPPQTPLLNVSERYVRSASMIVLSVAMFASGTHSTQLQ